MQHSFIQTSLYSCDWTLMHSDACLYVYYIIIIIFRNANDTNFSDPKLSRKFWVSANYDPIPVQLKKNYIK